MFIAGLVRTTCIILRRPLGNIHAGHKGLPGNRLGNLVMKKILLFAVVALSFAAPAYAAPGNASTASGAAAATVVAPIVLTHTASSALNFGSFTTGTGGTVVVTAAGAGSVTGDVGFVPASTEAADQFTVKGDINRSFTVTTGSGSVSNGSVSMAFTTVPSTASATLSASGTGAFAVGGTLTVVGTETAGTYNGSYNATVAYN
jgi:hypothetical protein